MLFLDWLNSVVSDGLVCDKYTEIISKAKSKKQFMDACLTADGVSFISQLCLKGKAMPYEMIMKEFCPFVNGRYVKVNETESGGTYTASLWCCFGEDMKINANATTMAVMGCDTTIVIPKNWCVKIFADNNCRLVIRCPNTSRCIVEYCDGAKVEVVENHDRVKLVKAKDE